MEILFKIALTLLVVTIMLCMATRVSADEDTWMQTSARTLILFWMSVSGLVVTVGLFLAGLWSL